MKTFIRSAALMLGAAALSSPFALSQENPEMERMQRDMEEMMRMWERNPRAFPEMRRMMEHRRLGDGRVATAAGGWRIGVMVRPIDPVLRGHLNLPEGSGVVVNQVMDGSPAAKAGIKVDDLILAAGEQPVGSFDVLVRAVAKAAESGEPLVLTVMKSGKTQTVTIDPPPKTTPDAGKDSDRKDRDAEAADQKRSDHADQRFERMTRSMREMQEELRRQREMIRRLEERISRKPATEQGEREEKAD